MKYTREYEEWFVRLAAALGKDIAEGANHLKIGAWLLDYNPTGVVISEIVDAGGGVTHPLTDYRLHPFEFGVMCGAVIKAQGLRAPAQGG